MDRREFLAATAVAAVSPLPKLDTLAQSATRQYIELQRYHLLPGNARSIHRGDRDVERALPGSGRLPSYTAKMSRRCSWSLRTPRSIASYHCASAWRAMTRTRVPTRRFWTCR